MQGNLRSLSLQEDARAWLALRLAKMREINQRWGEIILYTCSQR